MSLSNQTDREFLYKTPNFVGVLDDSFTDLWYTMKDDWKNLKKHFEESNFTDFLIELTHVFKNGDPHYAQLSELLAPSFHIVHGNLFLLYGKNAYEEKESFEEQFGVGKAGMDEGEKIICQINNVERVDKDISKVELDISVDDLKINELVLFVNEMPDTTDIINILGKEFNDLSFESDQNFTIISDYCKITLVKE